jgi:hypothetical protein
VRRAAPGHKRATCRGDGPRRAKSARAADRHPWSHGESELAALPARPQGLNLCAGVSQLQGLTWPFIERARHFVQLGLRAYRQIGAFWKVLSQQAIGVIRSALPRALRRPWIKVADSSSLALAAP